MRILLGILLAFLTACILCGNAAAQERSRMGDIWNNAKELGAELRPVEAHCAITPVSAAARLCSLLLRNETVLLSTPIARLGNRLAEAADRGRAPYQDQAKALVEDWYRVGGLTLKRRSLDITSVLSGDAKLGIGSFGDQIYDALVLRLKDCGDGLASACTVPADVAALIGDTVGLVRQTHPNDRALWAWFVGNGW